MRLFGLESYRGSRICAALSGGVDSVCLLHYLFQHAEGLSLSLTAVHVDHGIRRESARDLEFCRALCEELKVPLFIERRDVPAYARLRRLGLEEAGREVRYDVFAGLIGSGKTDFVATAHHSDDAAETILFRLARGTSLGGMRAISAREGIIRPLLGVSRAEILRYAEENGLSHVEDATNSDQTFARNYIRHTVMPAFEQICEGAKEHLLGFAAQAVRDDEFLNALAAGKIVRMGEDAAVPADLPDALFARACLMCMRAEKDYTQANFSELIKLKTLQSGKRVCLPGGQEAVREYGNIVFYMPEEPDVGEAPFLPEYGGALGIKEAGGGLRFDLDAFPKDCVIRTRREGDFIVPFGGRKKPLKKFLTDRKIPARIGRKLKLVACGDEVLLIVGVEISDKIRVREGTKRIGAL